jgi:membrane protein
MSHHAFKHLLFDLPYRAVEKWLDDDASMLAAAVAYYFAISLFPLLLIMAAVVGFVLKQTQYGQDAQQQVIAAAGNQVSPAFAEQISTLLSTTGEKASVSGPLGLMLLLATSIAMFVQLDRAFDLIWNIPPPKAHGVFVAIKRVLFVRLRAFVMLVGIWGLVMIASIAGLVLTGVDAYASDIAPYWAEISWWLRHGLSLAINLAACTLIFKFLSRMYVAWHEAFSGAILAGVGWEIGRLVLAAYVIGQEYTSAYGVIGSFLAVMLWCYYVIAVLLLGAEYAHAMGEDRRKLEMPPQAPIGIA